MIKFAMLARGIKPIDLSDYRYMELGYGQGVSLNIHAAASGKEYWGTDFNPNHATIAMQFAKASGADVKVLDASFEDLAARDDLPEFDLITMHGV
ncbi:MAG: methyltransferase domain-containing protein [Hyphomicrobiales bacterium]